MQSVVSFVGVDVGSREFVVARHGHPEIATFENTDKGMKTLIRYLKKKSKGRIRVLLESTGNYGLDLAMALHDEKRTEPIYINPRTTSAFAKAGALRAKTDKVDAQFLAMLCANGHGEGWSPPPFIALQLRGATRRIRAMVTTSTKEKNRLKALQATNTSPDFVIQDIERSIQFWQDSVDEMRAKALALAFTDDHIRRKIELLTSIPGVASATALELVAEILCLPSDLSARQLVACAGLDPKPRQSGKRDSPRRISKMGSPYLRMILHMAALNSVRCCPAVKQRHEALVARGKRPLVAYVAISRKLLHCVHGMLKTGTTFEPEKFSGLPR